MRNALLTILVALLPASMALAEQAGNQKSAKPANSERTLPVKRAGTSDSCASYGAGFVKIEGTDSCMKIGGAVDVGVGSSIGGR